MNIVARLFESFQPSNYNLTITHNRTERTFISDIVITGCTLKPSTEIRLHMKELEVIEAYINDVLVKTTPRANDDELILHATTPLAPGEYAVRIKTKGKITNPMHGLYPCYFKDGKQEKELLATQLESHHAREVFACIDEPEAKASFDLTLLTEPNVTVLANTPVKKQQEDNGMLVTAFDTTPKMSVYLLAWVIGELHNKTGKTKDGVEVKIWATPAQKLETLDFALDVAIRTIEFYNDYFGVPYPLAKCDLIALPDFSAGAMENWGCITFREQCLLVDPKNTSIPAKQYVAMVITHELAHQWFGNLVTMKWWDDLWLNESFASLMEFVTIDDLFPEWKIWLDFSTQDTLSALRRDRLQGVQAVRIGVNHPDEISALFDPSIVYAKGAKLLQMLYFYVGDEAWRTGLRDYFTKHAYSNTVADDLWNSIGTASGKDVAALMMPWLTRPGYPLITVTQTNDNTYAVTQERFLSNPADRKADMSKPWPVPLMPNVDATPDLLETREAKLTAQSNGLPLKLNSQDRTLLVTHYATPQHRQALKQAVASGQFNEVDRLQLLNEAILLASAGVISQPELLELLDAYRQEENMSVWEIVALAIGDTRKLLEHDDTATNNLRRFTARLIEQEYKRLGWDKLPRESDFDTMLRGLILGSGIFAEHEPIVAEAKKRFAAFKQPEDLPADLRDVIYRAGIRFGGQAEFDKLVALYEKTHFAEEKNNLASGLVATRNTQHIAFLLEKLKDTDFIRLQDTSRWFAYLMRNRHSRAATWQWLVQEWDGWIHKQFGDDKSYDAFPRYAASVMSSRTELKAFKNFFGKYVHEPALTRAIEVGLEDIETRVLWRERDEAATKAYLAKQLQ